MGRRPKDDNINIYEYAKLYDSYIHRKIEREMRTIGCKRIPSIDELYKMLQEVSISTIIGYTIHITPESDIAELILVLQEMEKENKIGRKPDSIPALKEILGNDLYNIICG
jgi:hypothetical protein